MLLLRMRPGVSDEEAVKLLERGGIDTQSLSSHYAGRNRQHGLLLSFAGFSEEELAKAARKLIEVLS